MKRLWHCQGMAPSSGPARQRSIRAANLALVYRLILDAPAPLSRAALSGATGMTRATAGALADALLAAGLVDEVSPPPAVTAGRPAAGLVAARSGAAGLGLEVNVDYLAACVVDLAGTVRHRVVVAEDQRGRDAVDVLRAVTELGRKVAETADGADGLRTAGVAVAVPGLVGRESGLIRRAPNLGWRDVAVDEALKAFLPATPLPAEVGNEADFAALAELDADRALRDFLYVSGEIGVGAGIVFDRALFRGGRGWAGEIGHVTVEPDGTLCRCGAHGCLETVAGLEALDDLPRAGAGLGRAIAAALNLLDLGTVVLGGSYAGHPELLPIVQDALTEHVISAPWSPVDLRCSEVGEAAAAVGAAASVVRRIHDDPAGWMEVSGAE